MTKGVAKSLLFATDTDGLPVQITDCLPWQKCTLWYQFNISCLSNQCWQATTEFNTLLDPALPALFCDPPGPKRGHLLQLLDLNLAYKI